MITSMEFSTGVKNIINGPNVVFYFSGDGKVNSKQKNIILIIKIIFEFVLKTSSDVVKYFDENLTRPWINLTDLPDTLLIYLR